MQFGCPNVLHSAKGIYRMQHLPFKFITALALCGTSLAVPQIVHAQTYAYTLKDLSTFGANTNVSQGLAVNNAGQVAGYSYTSEAANAFLSGSNGGALHNLGTLGGYDSTAYGVNAAGQVTGYGRIADNTNFHAFLSDPNGGALHDLGTLGGDRSIGLGVNSNGQVAGGSDFVPGLNQTHAFLSDPNGGALHDLGTLGGGNSGAQAVNDAGEVTGNSSLAGDSTTHAFISAPNGGALKDLGTLGGSGSTGLGINNLGQVAGSASTGSNSHAFLSAPNGGSLQDLGTLHDGNSQANAVNDLGQVVGQSDAGIRSMFHPPLQDAFLFSNGTMIDLNSLIAPGSGLTLASAFGITDTGLITGYAYTANYATTPDGGMHAFLLTPNPAAVPEASTTVSLGLLLALGLSGAVVAARKKKVAV